MANRPEAGYQREDLATVRGWLGDPEAGIAADTTLAASIATVTSNWRGFYPSLELLPTASYEDQSAPVPPATVGVASNPAACAAWRLGYGTDLSERQALTGGLLQGLPAILFITLMVQPYVRQDTPYELAETIRDELASLARAASMTPYPSVPVAQTFGTDPWSGWSIIVRFWSITTP